MKYVMFLFLMLFMVAGITGEGGANEPCGIVVKGEGGANSTTITNPCDPIVFTD